MNAASCAREAGCDQKKQGDATKSGKAEVSHSGGAGVKGA